MGYSLDFNLFLNSKRIGLEVSHINRKPIEEIYTAVLSRVEAWMRNNMGARSWARIASYNSNIGLNQYRVVFRTGFGDREIVDRLTGRLIRALNGVYNTTDGDWGLFCLDCKMKCNKAKKVLRTPKNAKGNRVSFETLPQFYSPLKIREDNLDTSSKSIIHQKSAAFTPAF